MSRSTFIDKVTGYKLPTLFKKEFGAGVFPRANINPISHFIEYFAYWKCPADTGLELNVQTVSLWYSWSDWLLIRLDSISKVVFATQSSSWKTNLQI